MVVIFQFPYRHLNTSLAIVLVLDKCKVVIFTFFDVKVQTIVKNTTEFIIELV
jgi:hypothetical protein